MRAAIRHASSGPSITAIKLDRHNGSDFHWTFRSSICVSSHHIHTIHTTHRPYIALIRQSDPWTGFHKFLHLSNPYLTNIRNMLGSQGQVESKRWVGKSGRTLVLLTKECARCLDNVEKCGKKEYLTTQEECRSTCRSNPSFKCQKRVGQRQEAGELTPKLLFLEMRRTEFVRE